MINMQCGQFSRRKPGKIQIEKLSVSFDYFIYIFHFVLFPSWLRFDKNSQLYGAKKGKESKKVYHLIRIALMCKTNGN